MVFTDDYTKKSYLVYKYEIYSFDPLYKADVYVNAKNGEVVFENSLIHHTNVPASGATLYDGTVNFTADQTGTNAYRLRQTSTGNGIETYSSNNQFDYTYGSAVDVTSTSNIVWPSSTKAAVQAHYGAEQTHGYFLTKHARNSFDNLGSVIKSYVNFGVGYNNAFWDGVRMTYGDGDGVVWGPLVSLDIVGHEIAHGVTTYSAGLFYRRESGALNESFSDIFGEAVEKYAKGTNNWQMGTEIGIGGSGALRSMDNPNLFNDPDTYGGDFWWDVNCTNPTSSGNDYCGVHHNSGVQNKWFYILSAGEAGTNDIGNSYSVTGIGMDKAGAIAYRNLTQYLTTTSTFADARAGAIASAEDLYGIGSAEAIATAEAWYAVGVGATGTASSCANTVVNSAAPTHYSIDGYVFDVDAINDIIIEDFKVSYYTNISAPCTDIVDVYSRAGTYVGNTGSLTGWTLVGSTSLQSAALGALVPLNLGANIAVAAGQTQAFMLVQRGGSGNCGMISTLNGAANTNTDLTWGQAKIIDGSYVPSTDVYAFYGEICYALPCAISSVAAGTQTPCVNNLYSQDVTVTYGNAPATGTLDVNGQSFAITSSPQTVTLTNLVADGNPVNVTAAFSADAGCTLTETGLFTAPAACQPATGLSFDGVDDQVQLGPINITGAISIEAWVKPSLKNNFLTILNTKIAGFGNPGFLFAINEYNTTSGKLVFETSNAAVISNVSVTWDVWQHVAFTYDGTTAKMYINGVDVGTTNVNTGVNLQASTNPAYISRIPLFGGSTDKYVGALDEVRVWNTNKSGPEIMVNKDCALTGSEVGLIAYYNFDNGIVNGNNAGLTTLTDQTSNGNDGTLQNFALTGATSNWAEGAAISGVCAPTTCAATASFRLYGQNKLWKNAGASDENVFYYGVTQTKKVSANATGGVGPYTYTWSNSQGYQLKSQSADGRSIRLFEPQGPSYMVCEIYDAGANCTFKDSVFVDWTDVFWCGTTGGTPADFWKLTMCVDGITSCMTWNAAKAALKDPNVTASLGACSTPKANLSSSAVAFVIYPNPSNGLLNINFTSTSEATASIEVVDMNGRVLQSSQVQTNIGIVESNLDLSGLANGMYFVRLVTAESTSTQRVQIAK